MDTESRKQTGVHKAVDSKRHGSPEKKEYSVYSRFNLKKHKETYINYLEIVIKENGRVEYAVPSHQEAAIRLACKKHRWTREQLYEKCPPEYYLDFLPWLLKQSGAISVWDTMYIGEANELQKQTLIKLRDAGLYKGEI